MVASVVIYSASYCPYCDRAKSLFQKKGANYQEIDVTHDDNLREEMMRKSGGRKTVPQIFINDLHIGGCDDLHALEQERKLDPLLK